MLNRKLISSKEDKISFLQLIGFILLLLGIISIIRCAFITNGTILDIVKDNTPTVIAISFFVTMLGFSLAFPSLLQGNDGISTMRIVVFMMTNVICMLLLKIGWGTNIHSLKDIQLDRYWMGVIAFVFGAKATQSLFESRMVEQPTEPEKAGMAAVSFTNAEIAKLALVQNEQYLKTKFPNILSVSDTVHDLNHTETHVIALYLKNNNTAGIPDKLEVKMPDGTTKTISTEIINGVGSGEIQINQKDLINTNESMGSVCCIIETEENKKKLVTSGHVYSNGYYKNMGGEISNPGTSKVQIKETDIGNWFFQCIDDRNDIALASIDKWKTDPARISFSEHYKVSDTDVKKKLVKVVSGKSIPKERDAYILDYNTAWEIPYKDGPHTKNNIIVIGNNPDRTKSKSVTIKGDSGGCVYDPDSGQLVGIILGGNDSFSWILPLGEIFEIYNYKLI